MSSQRTFFKFIFFLVALVLLLDISFSLISASPAEAAEADRTQENTVNADLIRQIEELTALVNRLSNQDSHILLLRIEQRALGDSVTLNHMIVRVTVDRRFFDSCAPGDDITNSPWIQTVSEPLVGEFRILVVDKYIGQR